MENLPIDKTFAIVKWWASQKPTDKLLVFLLACIISVSTVAIRLYSTNSDLQIENLAARVECEQRVASSTALQRNKDDSILAERERRHELEKQEIYNRVGIIKERNEKIEKALR